MEISSPSLPDLPSGIYRHYKGHHYLVLGYAHDSNLEDRTVVVYVGLQLEDAGPGPRMNIRTVEDFYATVTHDGQQVKRFTYVGPSWSSQV